MRIIYSFPNRIGAPGIGTTAFEQVRSLDDLGVHVQSFCTSMARPTQNCTTTLSILGRRIPHSLFGVYQAHLIHDLIVATFILSTKQNWDALHSWPIGSLWSIRAARKKGIRTVIERPNCHTRYAVRIVSEEMKYLGLPLDPMNSHSPHPRRLKRELKEYDAVDLLLAPSPFVRRTLVNEGIDISRTFLTQYGCDLARFQFCKRNFEGPIKFLYIGRIEPRKGVHYLLEAWQKIPISDGHTLKIIGNCSPTYFGHLRSLITQPGITYERFTQTPEDEMRKADVLVLPSIEEGSALVTYEAMATGCIPLVSDASGARCDHLETGMIHNARNVQQLTSHMNQLIRNRSLMRAISNALESYRNTLSWRQCAKLLMTAYQTPIPAESKS